MTGAELLAKIGIGQGMRLVSKALDHLAPDKTKAFEASRDEMFREWQAETSRAMVDVCNHLHQRIQDLETRFEEQAQDPQFRRVLNNVQYEAAREAIDERRRMLAHVWAGVWTPELTIAQKARVERTLRELDPDDVKLLNQLTGVPGLDAAQKARARHQLVTGGGASGEILQASGCVRVVVPPIWDSVALAYLNTLGTWVVAACASYIRSLRPDQPTPERSVSEVGNEGEEGGTWE